MKVNEAVKAADTILRSVASYAHLAAGWDIKAEDDFNDLRGEIIDILTTEVV